MKISNIIVNQLQCKMLKEQVRWQKPMILYAKEILECSKNNQKFLVFRIKNKVKIQTSIWEKNLSRWMI